MLAECCINIFEENIPKLQLLAGHNEVRETPGDVVTLAQHTREHWTPVGPGVVNISH